LFQSNQKEFSMRPFEILMEEHRVIEQVLNCLEHMADRCEAGAPLDIESAASAIDFFRVFADRCHHGKEEDLLFPLMEQKGFSREQGPTGVMLDEHEQGRRHVRGMADALKELSLGDLAGKILFVEHARAFVRLLREHIYKEDHCLFPMADQAFSATDQDELAQSFVKVEHEDMGPGTHEKYLQLANQLADRFGVIKVTSLSGACAGCCGHHAAQSPGQTAHSGVE
jgi:hemerythrin-like domain-containing protein